MVFHGDYEVYFEIHQTSEDDWRSELLGYMAGISADDAKARWLEAYPQAAANPEQIIAVPPLNEWQTT